MTKLKVLVACEFSGVVREAFRKKGHDAYSCDILPDINNSKYHYTDKVENYLNKEWDLIIAHPPCTWLCSAMRSNAARKDRPHITKIFFEEREKAYNFALSFFSYANRVCVENPVGYINSKFRKPDQIARPFMFGHEYNKDVCLWLKNLPILKQTKFINPPYKKFDLWSTKRNPGGYSLKSITYQGIADAMADQWG